MRLHTGVLSRWLYHGLGLQYSRATPLPSPVCAPSQLAIFSSSVCASFILGSVVTATVMVIRNKRRKRPERVVKFALPEVPPKANRPPAATVRGVADEETVLDVSSTVSYPGSPQNLRSPSIASLGTRADSPRSRPVSRRYTVHDVQYGSADPPRSDISTAGSESGRSDFGPPPSYKSSTD